MKKDVIDIHTHTLASGHAYSTIHEMAKMAKQKGIKILGITEHGPAMTGSCKEIYFKNLHVVSRDLVSSVELMIGAELNIMDFKGSVDLPQSIIEKLDIVIASLHSQCITPGSVSENTEAYINVMKNTAVNVIGHPDDGNFPVDYRLLAKEAMENKVILEINNGSYIPTTYRKDAYENCEKLLHWCMEYGTNVIMSSDAHFETGVGDHALSKKLLQYTGFPDELVLNYQPDKFKKFLKYRKNMF